MEGDALQCHQMSRPLRLLVFVLTVAVVAALGAVHARLIAPHPYSFTGTSRFGWLVVYIIIIWVTTYTAGVLEGGRSIASAAIRSFVAVGSAALLVSAIALVAGSQLLPRFVVFASAGALAPTFVACSAVSTRSRRRREAEERIFAVVSDEEAALLARDLAIGAERAAHVVAQRRPEELRGATGNRLETLALGVKTTLLVLNRHAQADDDLMAEVARLHAKGVRVRTLSLFYDEWLGKLPITELERISLMFDINEVHQAGYARLKRFVDIAVATVGLVPLALALPIVGLLDLAANRGPVLFRQQRVGKDGALFTIIKFRTMAPDSGPSDWTKESDPRVGPIGRLLRRLHVDELPQVINVLRRDLSIVGPRPEQPRYVAELAERIPFYDVRHLVRPGITGWAQVKYPYGASELDALEKLQYEFYYLRHQSLGLDLRIIARTLRSMLDRPGR